MKALDWKLNQIFKFAKKNTAFYKKSFKNFNSINAKNFHNLPFLEPEDIYKNTPPNGTDLLSGKPTNSYVLITGGTAKKPKYVFRHLKDFKGQSKYFKGINMKPTDRVANLFSAGMWGGFISWNKGLEEAGCLIAPLGHVSLEPENIDAAIKIMQDLKINTLVGVLTTMIRLAQYFEKHKNKKLKIEKILTAGELVTKDIQEYLSKAFKGALVRSLYATTETAVIGFQCQCLKTNCYHAYRHQYVEIVDPKTGEPAKKGEAGEVVVTNLNKRLMSIIRFRTGDMGCLITQKCKCGWHGKTLKVLGRIGDILCIEGTNIPPNVISEVLSRFPSLTQNFQMIAKKKNKKDILLVKIESKSKKSAANVASKVKYAINRNVSEKLFGLEVKIVPENALSRNKINGKVIRVVDLRKKVF